jgi:hypothetical protein
MFRVACTLKRETASSSTYKSPKTFNTPTHSKILHSDILTFSLDSLLYPSITLICVLRQALFRTPRLRGVAIWHTVQLRKHGEVQYLSRIKAAIVLLYL